jgi:hypothetical protein
LYGTLLGIGALTKIGVLILLQKQSLPKTIKCLIKKQHFLLSAYIWISKIRKILALIAFGVKCPIFLSTSSFYIHLSNLSSSSRSRTSLKQMTTPLSWPLPMSPYCVYKWIHLACINKGLDALTLHMPHMPNVSPHYQCLCLSPRLKHRFLPLIPFIPTI